MRNDYDPSCVSKLGDRTHGSSVVHICDSTKAQHGARVSMFDFIFTIQDKICAVSQAYCVRHPGYAF